MSPIARSVIIHLLRQIGKYSDMLHIKFGLCILNPLVELTYSRLQMVIQTVTHDSPDKFTKLSPIKQAFQHFSTYRH